MDQQGRYANRRRMLLIALAVVLIAVGLVSAMSAPGAPPRSNKADAYGGPAPSKPKNPKSVAACNKYYGAANNLADARECRAIAHKNIGLAKCNKKKGTAKTKCVRAVNKKFAKEESAIAKQRAAEKACTQKYRTATNGLDPESPDYDSKLQAASDEFNTCMKNARG